MAINKQTILTRESYQQLKEEFKYLKTVKRKEIIKQIKEAKEFGDLSENAAYKEAREAESLNESKIKKIEYILKTAKIVDATENSTKKICLGSVVEIEKGGEVLEYTIVDPIQADFKNRKISIHSPIGKSMLGKCVGDEITVDAPSGKMTYKIISIK